MATVAALEDESVEEKFQIFMNEVIDSAKDHGVGEPVLPRARQRTLKMAFLKGAQPVHSDITDMYRSIYFKVFETMKKNIKERFDQKGHQISMDLENLLFKSAVGEDCKKEFNSVTKFYGSDINPALLETQLLTYTAKFKEFKTENIMLENVKQFMRQPGYAQLLSEVSTVLKLLLILPTSNL